MSILVTGGAGFIGSHLIERLLNEITDPIVCLDNYNDYYDIARKHANVEAFHDSARVTLVTGDFCDAAVLDRLFEEHGIRQVVHLGAYAGVRSSIQNPLVYLHTNVCGTASLLEAARKHPVDRFVFASSSTVYGNGAKAPFVEDAPLGVPLSPYGASKRAAELLCETYYQLHNVPTVSLRFFSVYGPRLRPDLALSIFTGKILSGEEFPLYGDGTIRRDFTQVSDVCGGILAALSVEGVVGEAINLGHDEPIEVRQVISVLEAAIGKEARIDHQPESAGDMPVTHADLTKAKRLLDYQPSVPFDEGVADYVRWFRDQLCQ
ncbi:MAG: GDP-mannose 4,6-dehydratase [Planctomycetes bacterium]|nr:GDP-mannose 4,6-dehydratase [Planctomycetota bacterium]